MTSTVRIGEARYERPFTDEETGEQMVRVWYDDGERFLSYYVSEDVETAWAKRDALTEA